MDDLTSLFAERHFILKFKQMKYFLLFALTLFCLISCGDDDDYGIPIDITMCTGEIISPTDRTGAVSLDITDWPLAIRSYIASELPGYSTISVLQYESDSAQRFFLVELDSQGALLFSESLDFICAEGDFNSNYDDDEIAIENLPQSIIDYINTNYPGIGIDEAEFEDGEYEIELDNDIELCFDAQGNFIGEC